MDMNTLITIAVVVVALLFMYIQHRQNKKKEAEYQAVVEANKQAWAVSPYNPERPNYDPVALDQLKESWLKR